MGNDLRVDLRELVTRRRILVIAGVGLSSSANTNALVASRIGLLKPGLPLSRPTAILPNL
jgi:hypothetical protein